MSAQVKQCTKCTEPADGLDDEHCQLHWEELCAKGWWEMINHIQVQND